MNKLSSSGASSQEVDVRLEVIYLALTHVAGDIDYLYVRKRRTRGRRRTRQNLFTYDFIQSVLGWEAFGEVSQPLCYDTFESVEYNGSWRCYQV